MKKGKVKGEKSKREKKKAERERQREREIFCSKYSVDSVSAKREPRQGENSSRLHLLIAALVN